MGSNSGPWAAFQGPPNPLVQGEKSTGLDRAKPRRATRATRSEPAGSAGSTDSRKLTRARLVCLLGLSSATTATSNARVASPNNPCSINRNHRGQVSFRGCGLRAATGGGIIVCWKQQPSSGIIDTQGCVALCWGLGLLVPVTDSTRGPMESIDHLRRVVVIKSWLGGPPGLLPGSHRSIDRPTHPTSVGARSLSPSPPRLTHVHTQHTQAPDGPVLLIPWRRWCRST